MHDSPAQITRTALLNDLCRAASDRGVSEDVVRRARIATSRRLPATGAAGVPGRDEARARAYFGAVVRRESVKRGRPACVAARYVVASVIHDLRAAGRDSVAIWEELERGWDGMLPAEVLEEYRLELCG